MPVVVQCGACQKQFQAGDHLAGKQVKCPGCQTPLLIPGGQATPQQPQAPAAPSAFDDLLAEELPTRQAGIPGMADSKCPGCGAVVDPEAILCIDCGYNFQKQKQVVPDTPSDREARFEARSDKMAGRDLDPVKRKKKAGKGGEGIGWILFSFEGRIPRRVFWAASLGIGGFNGIAYLIFLGVAGGLAGPEGEGAEGNAGVILAALAVYLVFALVALIANLAVQVKRLHDRGRAGALVLLPVIPIVGVLFAVWLFVETGFLRGTVGANEYGDDPT